MTQRMYYTDSYAQAFSACVVSILDLDGRCGLVLDRTCFYPTSGGQRADLGEIAGFDIIDVIDQGEKIVHVVETGARPGPERGATVEGRIDWRTRFDHMQQHTGQHILSQAFLQSVGGATISFHMSETSSTIDLNLEAPTAEQIEAAEDLANRIVFENRPVRIDFIAAEAQTEVELRKRSERTGTLRLVSIEGFDRSACGGTHCSRTGEVGLIKVRRWERVRRQARIEFVCGNRALRDYRSRIDILSRIGEQFSVSERDLPATLERQKETVQELTRSLAKLQDRTLELEAARAAAEAVHLPGRQIVRGIWDGLDMKQLHRLASLILADEPNRIALLASRGDAHGLLMLARGTGPDDLDMRVLLRRAVAEADGRGGGSADRAQAGGCRIERLERALERVFEAAGGVTDHQMEA